ncbi:hypothetical protein ACTA71_003172 [Dictyostelium dimigraforme]
MLKTKRVISTGSFEIFEHSFQDENTSIPMFLIQNKKLLLELIKDHSTATQSNQPLPQIMMGGLVKSPTGNDKYFQILIHRSFSEPTTYIQLSFDQVLSLEAAYRFIQKIIDTRVSISPITYILVLILPNSTVLLQNRGHREGTGIAEFHARTVSLFLRRMVTGENFNEINTFGYNDLNSSFLKNWFKNELQLLLNSSITRSNKYAPAEIVFGRLPEEN